MHNSWVSWTIASAVAALALLAVLYARRALLAARREADRLRIELGSGNAAAAEQQQLLRSIVDTTPVALVLFGESGTIAFANTAARGLFFDDADVSGQNFLVLLKAAPESLRRAVLSSDDEIFTVMVEGEEQSFYLSKRSFSVHDAVHTLVAVKEMSRELNRQELATLKNVIRIIHHEIGNSLGPIGSLVSSARLIAQRPEHLAKLDPILQTVAERANHLQQFLSGYATMAKVPHPKPQNVPLNGLLAGIAALYPHVRVGDAPGDAAYLDPAQVQQVLINLIKNACESGGPEHEVRLDAERPAEGGLRFTVLDRGAGMSEEVLHSALLPFFTTKPKGSGLGLTLCREVVDLHGGRLRLAKREGGGSAVSFWLPDHTGTAELHANRTRLTLTRG